jgi:hypothetical protein
MGYGITLGTGLIICAGNIFTNNITLVSRHTCNVV